MRASEGKRNKREKEEEGENKASIRKGLASEGRMLFPLRHHSKMDLSKLGGKKVGGREGDPTQIQLERNCSEEEGGEFGV